ncbi:MAG: nicotinate-nucleotide adenylyltransferase [Pseudomonadota bacterium]
MRPFISLPPAGARQTVGILGGSFNPAHAGHRQISLDALKRLGLDWVWWLVSPGNPLKSHAGLEPLDVRMAQARAVAAHPRIKITDLEARLFHPARPAYSARTLGYLRRRRPDLHFVWLMGADNLASFHRWHAWQAIADSAPIAVFDRPGYRLAACASTAAHRYGLHSVESAKILARQTPPHIGFITIALNNQSSTALRRKALPPSLT